MKCVAVLGAGIMGTSTALFLARAGVSVTVFDAAAEPVSGASRWNEGKIHLGYLYAGDPSLGTATRLLPGGCTFRPLVETLIDGSIDAAIAPDDDLYLVHRASVVPADDAARYYAAVTAAVRDHPDSDAYLTRIRPVERLTAAELDAVADTAVVTAGFRVPERSVSTRWIADRLCAALTAAPLVTLRLGTTVQGVVAGPAGLDGPLGVATPSGTDGPFDAVVNALWEGRLAVDVSAGLAPPETWSHRYRLAVFVRTTEPVSWPSAVVGTGPFGDVKNYDGRNLYLSWYPAGLVAEGTEVTPPALPSLGAAARDALATTVIDELAALLPPLRGLATVTESSLVAGGWVYAAGRGRLDDRASTLHRRDRIGIRRHGRYVSVDTGKYSVAPWLARQVAAALT